MPDPRELIGQQVIVENPNATLHAYWSGEAVGYYSVPTIIIRQDDGSDMALPAAWARPQNPA